MSSESKWLHEAEKDADDEFNVGFIAGAKMFAEYWHFDHKPRIYETPKFSFSTEQVADLIRSKSLRERRIGYTLFRIMLEINKGCEEKNVIDRTVDNAKFFLFGIKK